MSNDLAPGPAYPVAVNSVQDLQQLGELLAKSGYFSDARQTSQVCVKILAGREMGFGPVASMNGFHCIEGKPPTVGAHLMAAMIKRSGKYNYKIKQHTREVCEIEFLERSGNKWESTTIKLTIQDAKDAGMLTSKSGKDKDNWKTHPDDMLFARVISKGYRRCCPDLSGGVTIYVPDELDIEPEADGNSVLPKAATKPVPAGVPEPVTGNAGNDPSGPLITDRQHSELAGLIHETGTDVMRVAAYYKIPQLDQLPASKYQELKDRLLVKKQADGKGQTSASVIITAEQAEWIKSQTKERNLALSALLDFVGFKFVEELPATLFTWIRLLIEENADFFDLPRQLKIRKPSDLKPERIAAMTRAKLTSRIDKLVEQLGITGEQFNTRVKGIFETDDPTSLSIEQLEELEQRMASYAQKGKKK